MAEFLDKLKRGIDKTVTTVTVRSKEILETSQLRSQVKSLQEEKQRALEELGNIVYTLYSQAKLEGGGERIRANCAALAELDQKIRDKEGEIHQVQIKAQEALGRTMAASVGVCDCGTPIYEGTKFCGGCGKKVEEILSRGAPDLQASTNQCPQCGAALSATAQFCDRCGAKLSV